MKKIVGEALFVVAILVYSMSVKCKEPKTIVDTQELPYILTDEDLSKLYTCKQDVRKYDKNIVEVSEEDARLLLCVSREEGGPTLEGQLWALRTILNRVDSDKFPNTVYDVITGDGQFEVYETGKYLTADVNSNTHLALAKIEAGWNSTQGALYWEADTNSDNSWHKKNLEYITTVEGNRYYK